MSTETMKSEKRIGSNLILLLLAVAGLAVFILFYDKAFPTASIDMKVSRDEAQRIAARYLEARGFRLSGYTSAITFDSDGVPAVYLQKTLGMEKANALMRGPVPVWYWGCRWFKPLKKEEYRVAVDPSGKVIRFRRELEEDKAGANLPAAAAARIAEDFLRRVEKVDLSGYERVEASTEKRKKRTDHDFAWKQKEFRVGEGELRLAVEVQGDQVGKRSGR